MTYFPLCQDHLPPSGPFFVRMSTLKVTYIYKYQISKFIFKCINRQAPISFQNWFTLNYEKHRYNTRLNIDINTNENIKNLYVPYARTTNYGLKQIKTDGPRIWNAIPNHIKNIKSISLFLNHLKTYYISQYVC